MTVDEMKAAVETILRGAKKYDWRELEIEWSAPVQSHRGMVYEVEAYSEYEAPELTFAALGAIAEACGTDIVDVGTGRESTGCETCDHGSEYGLTVRITNPKVNL